MNSTERQNAGLGHRIVIGARPMFHRVLGARPENVRDTLTELRRRFQAEVDEDTLARLELVLAEVMNNVAEHAVLPANDVGSARMPSIHLSIVCHDSGLACAISDDGASLPEHCILPRSLPAMDLADLPEGGFGWYLIQDLTQALCYYREGQRNFLAFNVPFPDTRV